MRKGLYDSKFEHDACGIGMLVNLNCDKTHSLVVRAIASGKAVAAQVDSYLKNKQL